MAQEMAALALGTLTTTEKNLVMVSQAGGVVALIELYRAGKEQVGGGRGFEFGAWERAWAYAWEYAWFGSIDVIDGCGVGLCGQGWGGMEERDQSEHDQAEKWDGVGGGVAMRDGVGRPW